MANIIVIDDHPPVLKLMASVCRAQGHDVMAYDNAIAGLEAIRELAPAVALVDRRLGEVDGLDLVRQARELSPGTRCVMVTGCTETQDIVLAMRKGAYNYVTKPFEAEHIITAVNEALIEPQDSPPTKQKLVIVYPKYAA
ncbi:response regulator [Prosthecobacter fusiformis]|nr:response regulator [Prosthecobacter fusiformis]